MNRKPRKDSILHNLPPEPRAKVDKWLFDKGMSYAQVAESCARFLGVKVSKSSVARYYQRRMEKEVSERVGKRVSGWGSEAMMEDGCLHDGEKAMGSQEVSGGVGNPPSPRCYGAASRISELGAIEMASASKSKITSMSGSRKEVGSWEELYPRFIEGLMEAAWEAMERYEFALKHEGYVDLKEARWIVRLMRLIIAARRAEHVRTLAMAERAAMRISFSFLVSRRRPGYGGQAGLKLGRKSANPLTKVQRAESFAALCARWDRERERELTGGNRRWT